MSIEVRDVSASYVGDINILRGVSLTAEKGKITCIIGPNGAGKSTVLKTIFGFLKPKKGEIFFNDEKISGVPPYTLPEKGLTYIQQRSSVFPDLSVLENLRLGAWTIKRKDLFEDALDRIFESLPILEEKRNLIAGSLSGGEQRMLELGRALLIFPKAMLVDEPSAGLAPKVAKEIYQKLEELKKDGVTILLADQNIKSGIAISDYVYVLKVGEIENHGPKGHFSSKMDSLVRDWLM